MSPSPARRLRLGIDVGGTNTDAVLIDLHRKSPNADEPSSGLGSAILATHKAPTTPDVLTGLCDAIRAVLAKAASSSDALGASNALVDSSSDQIPDSIKSSLSSISIGTTALLNALVERSPLLQKVSVIRLCGPATRSLPPFADIPSDVAARIKGQIHFADGGYEVDGRPIRDLNESEIERIGAQLPRNACVAICGVFSPVRPEQELRARDILRACRPDLHTTCSHAVSPALGLLERENATILNACLLRLAKKTVLAVQNAIRQLGLTVPLYLTTNGGTVLPAHSAINQPIKWVRSGPTNSMRGAAILAGLSAGGGEEFLVVDIGGTTADLGVLEKTGVARPAAHTIDVAGVRSNFPASDVVSVALGGGTIVRETAEGVKLGPDSVGFKLTSQAMCFGGDVTTLTDIALATNPALAETLRPTRDTGLSENLIAASNAAILSLLESQVDRLKTSPDPIPLLVVGGGSVILPSRSIRGASRVIIPKHAGFANAVGAAISKLSATIDKVYDASKSSVAEVMTIAEQEAITACLAAGAKEGTVEIVQKEGIPLAYLPGGMVRVVVIATGERGDDVGGALDSEMAEQEVGVQGKLETDSEIEVLQEKTAAKEAVDLQTYEPRIADGVWELSLTDLDFIADGAGILGCGGGGSPYKTLLRARALLAEGKKIRVVGLNSLKPSDRVLNAAFIGSPIASAEKHPNGCEITSAITAISTSNGSQDYIMALEIGGSNGLVPMLASAELDCFVLDADGMGRAFPRLDQFVPFIYGVGCTPTSICDESGNVVVMKNVRGFADLERMMRCLAVEMGSTAGLSVTPLDAEDAQKYAVKNSVSLAWRLGRAVATAKSAKEDPIQAILSVCPGKLLFSGKIVQVVRTSTAGFSRGELHLVGLDEGGFEASDRCIVKFQNENIVCEVNASIVCTAPDLITLLDADSWLSIATEEVRYGLRVRVFGMVCSPLLQTARALEIVGPKAFGYEGVEYKPIADGEFICRSVFDGV